METVTRNSFNVSSVFSSLLCRIKVTSGFICRVRFFCLRFIFTLEVEEASISVESSEQMNIYNAIRGTIRAETSNRCGKQEYDAENTFILVFEYTEQFFDTFIEVICR